MNFSYLFYDLETTGLNKAFDQVLQFAAIRTDMRFNEIERHEIIVKIRPDVIPSPKAMITHRISIAHSEKSVCEFEAIRQIHSLMNKAGTISIGYNNLNFDDEFLRFCFYRNLLPPYTHQYKSGCRRMDLLPITNMYYLYKKDVLSWPQVDGKLSLQLEQLSKANQLASGPAHNAMVDVEATVELARRLFFKESKMWQYLDGYFNKETDVIRTIEIPISFYSIACSNRIGLMVGNQYGVDNQYQIPVLLIGTSIPYKNQTIWLRLDQTHLRDTSVETIPKTWVIRKKYGEPGIVLPPHKRYWDCLSEERQAIVEDNKDWLQSNTQLFHKLIQYHCEFRYPKIPDLDCDASLYQNGFLPDKQQGLCSRFQNISLAEKTEMVSTFEDIDMRQLASRVLCRNYPDNLPTMMNKDFENYMQRINPANEDDALQDYKGHRRTTPVGALAEIKKLKNTSQLDKQQVELLDELENYLQEKFK